ncbi:MAG: hypothetical protein EOO03_16930 [Chitinophagaceae bacterium]|nr:MAG: hypothetical protein EOO03_16930 [Chitinophagaceae bacterium]
MRIIYTCFLVLFFGFSSSLSAQDIFIKITGANGVIAGESQNDAYRDHLDGFSFAQASTAACTSSAGGSKEGCMANTGNFYVVVRLDKSLNLLRKHMYLGTPLDKVEIFFTKNQNIGKNQAYYSIRLDAANLVSINDAISSGSDINTVQLEFDAKKIGWTQFPTGPDGRSLPPVKFGWDRSRNVEWTF